jgi:hypothetical protein
MFNPSIKFYHLLYCLIICISGTMFIACQTKDNKAIAKEVESSTKSDAKKSDTKKSDTTASKTKSVTNNSKTKSDVQSNTSTSNITEKDTFRIIYPAQKNKSGTIKQSVKIIAKSGYKVNTDFPARIKINPTKTLKFTANELNGELKDKKLVYTIDFEAPLGTHQISATADFSICDDSSCQLYRGEKLSWVAQVK